MEAAQIPWRPIGELFVEKGLITPTQLEEALAEQAATGARLGEILVQRNLISSPELTHALMEQLGREVAKEEGFGTGLWSEIRRRNAPAGSVQEPAPESHPNRSAFGDGLARKLAVVDEEYVVPSTSEEEPALAEFREPATPQWEGDADRSEGPAPEHLVDAELEIELLKQEVSERDLRLAELDMLEHDLETARNALADRDERIADLQRSVEELQSSEPEPGDQMDTAALEQELAAARGELAALQTAHASADVRASELAASLSLEREAHDETRRGLADAERDGQDARHALQEIERGFTGLQAERDAARSDATSAREALEAVEPELATLRDRISSAEAELAAERATYEEVRGRVDQTAAEAAEAQRAVDDRTRQRDEFAQRVQRLEEELAERHAVVAEHEQQLFAAESRTAELHEQTAGLSEQIERLQRERDEQAQHARRLEQQLSEEHEKRASFEDRLAAAEARSNETTEQISAARHAAEVGREDADETIRGLLREAEERAVELAEKSAKLHDFETQVAELTAILDGVEGDKAALSQAVGNERLELERNVAALAAQLAEEAAAHSETRCVLSKALAELSAREPLPVDDDDGEPAQVDYLCFAPTSDGYRFVTRTGVVPNAGEPCDVDGVPHLVTRIGHSPLPFDARPCVYLIANV